MPKRDDIKCVMIISSGPIVIGQGCEFDYSGTQACKALREEGIRIVLLNSNPATIMTDPEMADRTYIEPITPEAIDKILAREAAMGAPIDSLLPTLGGQTGLNCAMDAAERGILKKHNVRLIGANEKAIHKAEDRTEFKNAMIRIGLNVPRSGIAHSWEEAQRIVKEVRLPVAIRPAYTLGGTGGGFAFNMEEFEVIAKRGMEYSRVSEILIEESCLGWKEYELEVMRDRADNVVIICSIENFDPMGVHTGDSITVAPAQTLTDKEYQLMRDAAIKIIREIGVDTGGSNIQFAVHPDTGRMIVIEMNPRVSRSSALASKATGYPIARIAAKLAIGYTLDEIPNDITKKTPASFEPTIDYCVVKIPRWTFEKFPEANETLTTQMKSVGEAMSIGRTFKEALQKGIRSMEIKRFGLGLDDNDAWLAARGTAFQAVNRSTGFQPVDGSMGFQPMQEKEKPQESHEQHASGPEDHGQDARATGHGQDAHATAPWKHGDVQKREGACLPHWTADGATYFVTFRLDDSLPSSVLEGFVRERDEILQRAAAAGRATTPHEDKRLRELFSEKIETYLDAGHGECVLRDDRAAAIVRDALAHFDGQRYDVCAWCVVPNHVHVVLRPREGHELPDILHSWKSFTANEINKLLGRRGTLWQPEYFDHLIRDADDFERSLRYVLENPSAAGLKEWPWCGTGFQPVDRSMGFQPMDRSTAFEAMHSGMTSQPPPEGEQPGASHGQDAHATSHGLEARATQEEAAQIGGSRAAEAPADTKEQHAAEWPIPLDVLRDKLSRPCQGRPYYIRYAFKMGWTVEQIFELSKIDPWFLENMKELVEFEKELIAYGEQARTILQVTDGLSHREFAEELGKLWPELEAIPELDTREYERARQQAMDLAAKMQAATQEFLNRIGAAHLSREEQLRKVMEIGAATNELQSIIRRAKEWGYSDVQLAKAWACDPIILRRQREDMGVKPVYKLVDTCAAEFEAETPYYYSSYESPCGVVSRADLEFFELMDEAPSKAQVSTGCDDEIRVSDKPKVVILGGGPNRIGQGIEFDYCCVHAVMAARKLGYETVMVNSNPETVSTDYDTSDLLFFEPLTHEDVLNICERLNGKPLTSGASLAGDPPLAASRCDEPLAPPRPPHTPPYQGGASDDASDPGMQNARRIQSSASASSPPLQGGARGGLLTGVIVQFGGQTPLNLAKGLKASGVPILGTTPESIHLAEDREAFAKVLNELGLRQPENGIAFDLDGALKVAERIGYPVLVRPSYVLGGRAMEKCHLEEDLVRYMHMALDATDRAPLVGEKHPILIDKFLSEATEVDVDCLSDGTKTIVCGVMEHIEEAGIHSGDSACALPPYSLSPLIVDEIKYQSEALAHRLGVRGLMNVQFAVKDDVVYVLEVNPRASRTVPFVSKATGVPWAKLATQVMLGQSVDEVVAPYGLTDTPQPRHISVKEAVFPFNKFPEVDCVLGPEMRSTGEVMGIDRNFPLAFAKAQMAAGVSLPTSGTVLISVNDHDKPLIVPIARQFHKMGFHIISTLKTREVLVKAGIPAELVSKTKDPGGPYLIDLVAAGKVQLLVNTPIYWGSASTEGRIRSAAVMHNIPLVTTITGARAAVQAIKALRAGDWGVQSLQEYHGA